MRNCKLYRSVELDELTEPEFELFVDHALECEYHERMLEKYEEEQELLVREALSYSKKAVSEASLEIEAAAPEQVSIAPSNTARDDEAYRPFLSRRILNKNKRPNVLLPVDSFLMRRLKCVNRGLRNESFVGATALLYFVIFLSVATGVVWKQQDPVATLIEHDTGRIAELADESMGTVPFKEAPDERTVGPSQEIAPTLANIEDVNAGKRPGKGNGAKNSPPRIRITRLDKAADPDKGEGREGAEDGKPGEEKRLLWLVVMIPLNATSEKTAELKFASLSDSKPCLVTVGEETECSISVDAGNRADFVKVDATNISIVPEKFPVSDVTQPQFEKFINLAGGK